MKLEILSFAWNLFSSDSVHSVYALTKAWAITVLKDHAALATSLNPSVIEVKYTKNGETKTEDFAIWGWVLEVSNNKIKILVDMLVTVDNVDFEKAEKAKANAEKLMEEYKNSKDKMDMEKFIQANDMLLKNIAQLKLKR